MDEHRPCAREGCPDSRPSPGSKHAHLLHCTLACRMVEQFIEKAEESCRARPCPEAREVWLAAVALGDAQSEYRRVIAEARTSAQVTETQGGAPPPPPTGTGR